MVQITLKPSPGVAVLIHRRLQLLDYRIVRLVRVQRILHRTLDWLVVLGERPIGESPQRRKYPADAFRIHDERAHVVFRIESGLKSGTSFPTQLCAASFHQTCLRVGSQGLPEGSHDARLYKTRRFAGHDHAQFG